MGYQPLFIWWGQFGFKLHKKVCISTLGEAVAVMANATALKKRGKVEETLNAEVPLWMVMGML